MKVNIGDHLTYWGPYQIADALFGFPEDRWSLKETKRGQIARKLGAWLASTKLNDLCEWIHSKRKRKVKVKINNYDVWNMDGTLALIIGPMFVKLKENSHGSGFVDDEDVPEELRSTNAPPTECEWETDDNFHKRFQWLLDEMIWLFNTDHEEILGNYYVFDHSLDWQEQIKNCKVDDAAIDAYRSRLKNGYRLFGKYYESFWS